MKNKVLNYAITACFIASCAFSITACFNENMNGAKFTVSQEVSASTENIINDLTTNYYNASSLGSNKKYSVNDLKEKTFFN